MKQLHEIQLAILKKLLFAERLRFSEMKPDAEMENNQFTWHLDQIVEAGYVRKDGIGYRLTDRGKEYANQMDTEQKKIMRQAKLGVMICCVRGEEKDKEYLIYTRLKHPFFGCQGFPTGKIGYGEQVMETAKRELEEETGLIGEPTLITIRHYRVFRKQTGELVEDKFLFLCAFSNPRGALQPSDEGEYAWVKESEFAKYVTNPFESFESFLADIEEVAMFDGHIVMREVDHWSEKF